MHAESWVDQEVGIFGMTPQAVAASGDSGLRRKLEMEVNDMEWRNDREAGRDRPPLVDVVWIRRELGIPACDRVLRRDWDVAHAGRVVPWTTPHSQMPPNSRSTPLS